MINLEVRMKKRPAAAEIDDHIVVFRNGKPDIVLDMWASGWDWEDSLDIPAPEAPK